MCYARKNFWGTVLEFFFIPSSQTIEHPNDRGGRICSVVKNKTQRLLVVQTKIYLMETIRLKDFFLAFSIFSLGNFFFFGFFDFFIWMEFFDFVKQNFEKSMISIFFF